MQCFSKCGTGALVGKGDMTGGAWQMGGHFQGSSEEVTAFIFSFELCVIWSYWFWFIDILILVLSITVA